MAKRKSRDLNGEFELLLRAEGISGFVREYPCVPRRRYRWDFAWPDYWVCLDVQGATWVKSGHTTGQGIRRDCEKGNLAQIHGWTALHVTAGMIDDGAAIQHVKAALERAEELERWRR